MTDFDYEVMQRKRLAHQASHRKRGSKSKKCDLSTDHMTRRQWEKRCGEVMSYQMDEPMTWSQFKKLPVDIQKMYIQGMVDKYGATGRDLGAMFGCTSTTVTKHCGQELDIKFSPGHRMNMDQRRAFEQMLRGKSTNAEVSEYERTTADHVAPPDPPKSEPSGMVMDGVTLHFRGKFDKSMLYNSLVSIIPSGTMVDVTLYCNILNDQEGT